MGVMNKKVVGFVLGFLFIAVLGPVAFGMFGDSDTMEKNESFLAEATETVDTFEFTLSRGDLIPDSASVTVDGEEIDEVADASMEAGFDLTDSTGVLTISTSSLEIGETVGVEYEHEVNFGVAAPIWGLLGLFAVLALVWYFIPKGRFGLGR